MGTQKSVMPINKKKKLIFIHIPKNAGTSIAKALDMYGPSHEENKEIMYGIDTENIVLQSLPLGFWDNYIDSEFIKSCFIFTVVRNPFDRVVSDYCWQNRGFNTFLGYLKLIRKIRSEKELDEMIKYDGDTHYNHFLTQKEYTDSEKYKVDLILKFENISEEFKKHFSLDIPHFNPSKRKRDFRRYYKDQRCKDLVLEIYREDFERFDYDKSF